MRHSDVKASPYLSQAIARQRWDAIDAARGLAIVAMIVYHFSWDMSFLQLIETNILQVPAWRWFARGIAGSFLFLSGLGLVLAHAKGFHSRAFLKRLLKVGGAALAVTLATYFAFPESYIFFGILHCIAVSGVLALPLLRLHPAMTLVIAALCLVAPSMLTDPALDAPWLDWLGLGADDPVTNDYVPIFPWFGLVLLGVAAGRLLLAWQEAITLARWRSQGWLSRLLIWAGRKSLPIYLTHQIILLVILYGVLQIVGPNRTAEAQPFMIQCEATCLQNAQPQTCRALCSCTVETLRQGDLWQKVLNNTTTAEDQVRISRAAQQCLRQSPPS
ncbi:heparan-alpha-glucosaminide N-acetyltransferase [Microvirga sp. 0TCS3.31]